MAISNVELIESIEIFEAEGKDGQQSPHVSDQSSHVSEQTPGLLCSFKTEARRLAELSTDEFNSQFLEFIEDITPKVELPQAIITRILDGLVKPYSITVTDSNPYRYEFRENAVAVQIYDPAYIADGRELMAEVITRLAEHSFITVLQDGGTLIVTFKQ